MTSKLTREQLHERARENVKALKMASRQTAFESAREEILADLQLAELVLAAMDGEPVILYRQVNPVNGMKTYWAELDTEEFRHLKQHTDENAEFMTLYRHAQPAPEYPETLPCPVLLEPGLRLGKGIKTSTMLAALARRAVYESDLAALSPEERAEFQAGIEDVKALIAQPAPVVPEEATPDSIEILASARRRDHAVFQWDEDQRNAAADSWNALRDAMLQELQKSAGAEATCRSNENVQVLHTKSPTQSDCCPAKNSFAPAQSPIDHGYRPGCECSGCKATARICADLSANSPANPGCWCRTCRPVAINDMRFVVCPDCGNKRCPRANDHRNACTGSNEPGQEGSAYPSAPQEVKP
ncbi:hypothetical protein ACXDKE_003971 [Klebsiella pneumoniae]